MNNNLQSMLNGYFLEENIGFVLDHFANKALKTKKFSDERKDLIKTYSRIINIYASTDEIGDIMPFEDFYKSVKCGGFIDYDGGGDFMTFDGEKVGEVKCDIDWLKKNKPENAPFVVWYNK